LVFKAFSLNGVKGVRYEVQFSGDWKSQCPRCNANASIDSGTIWQFVDDLVELVTDADFGKEDAAALREAATSYHLKMTTKSLAIADLEKRSPRGAEELRNWLNCGAAVAAALSAVAVALMTYIENGGNEDPKEKAREIFEKVVEGMPQPDSRWDPIVKVPSKPFRFPRANTKHGNDGTN
tara:strand:- start:2186 stop:2725 length:540 start_codon:yes stop_codon:yes gene_type:complete